MGAGESKEEKKEATGESKEEKKEEKKEATGESKEEKKEEKKEATASEIASTAFAAGASVGLAAGAMYTLWATGSSNSNSNEYKLNSGYYDSDSNEKRMKNPGQKSSTIRRDDFEGSRCTSDSRGRSRPKMKCDHCGKDNHTIDRCYQLHGFPPKNKQSRVVAASVQQSPIVAPPSVESSDTTSSSTINSPAPHLSQEQYEHLLNLLTASTTPSMANLAGPINEK